jgi:CTP synthase (UTP-ammonia lyase)
MSMATRTEVIRIALVGDFSPEVIAHQAIDKSMALASQMPGVQIDPHWVPTTDLADDVHLLLPFHGIWLVPASPYLNTQGALRAIRHARIRAVPFLGTCGGFQHALLEFARHVLGFADADHSELNPEASFPFLQKLECPLVELSQKLIVTGERFGDIYGADVGVEAFHCRYGLNPLHEHLLMGTALEVVARSETGEVRAVQLRDHPFFVATLFQPERSALQGRLHPLVRSFLRSAMMPRPPKANPR